MLYPIFESYGIIDTFPVTDALKNLITKEMLDSASLATQLPYGNQNVGFAAGMIGQLVEEGGETRVEITNGTNPLLIFADSLVDVAKTGLVSVYYLPQANKFKVSGCYDKSASYGVGTKLTVVPSGTDKGKLTPAGGYGSQPIVGVVIEPPANPTNDDDMIIVTALQLEAV